MIYHGDRYDANYWWGRIVRKWGQPEHDRQTSHHGINGTVGSIYFEYGRILCWPNQRVHTGGLARNHLYALSSMPEQSLSNHWACARADVYSVILSLSALIKAAAAQIGKAPTGRLYPVYISAYRIWGPVKSTPKMAYFGARNGRNFVILYAKERLLSLGIV